MRIVKFLLPALLCASLFSSLSYAVTPDRISAPLTSGRTVALSSHVHRLALPQYDLGSVDPAFQMGTIHLLTVPTASQRKALHELVARQQDRKSSSYHKWLTPDQVADRFGLSVHDAQEITAWLKAQGFGEIQVAHTRNWVSFSATAAQVQSAFGTEIHRYSVNGQMHYANSTAPMIPAGLSGIVAGFRGLHDFKPRPMGIRRARPNYNSSSFGDLVAPGDIATMYDIKALYTGGIDGTGQKLAVVGQTDIFLADINDFRAGFGLSNIAGCTSNGTTGLLTVCNTTNFVYKLYGTDPGQFSPGDLGETDLDLEWSGATARNAQIIYVNAETGGGAFDAYYDAINDNLAPVISVSYGLCEQDNQSFIASDETELTFGNSEGITIVNSSGDSGAAQCDYSNTPAVRGPSVNYPASSPEVTSVGGTAIPRANFTSTYWGTVNGADGGTVLPNGPQNGYIPEQAWNDDDEIAQLCVANPTLSFCSTGNGTGVAIVDAKTAQNAIGISSTGGGPSSCVTLNSSNACKAGFAQPSWQIVTVAGQSSARFTPDISLPASPNFPGFIFCTELSEIGLVGSGSSCATGIANAVNNDASIIGGTSASAPIFAGIVTLLNQYTGGSQGNINPALYELAATAPLAFHDVTTSSNIVYCTTGTPGCTNGSFGFSAAAGYDLATGLGSVDVDKLAVALANPPDFTASTLTTTLNLLAGQSGTATIAVTPINSFSGTVGFACSGLPSGSTCSFSPSTVTPPVNQTVATIQAGGGGGVNGTVVITASTGVLAQVSHQAASIAVDVAPAFTLDPTVGTFQVAQGSSVDATATLTLASGFSGTVSFTCTDPASESTCTAPPSTNTSGSISFHVTTTAATTASNRPLNSGARVFYAALLPGLFGIMFTMGTRKRSSRSLRLLGLMILLGVSTLLLPSCGGSNSTNNGNPGTPKGNYTITVKGTSGSAIASNTFTLTVQ